MGCVISGVGVQNWLNSKLELTTNNVQLLHYKTQLTSQVEALEPTDRKCRLRPPVSARAKIKPTGASRDNLRVGFTPPVTQGQRQHSIAATPMQQKLLCR